MKLYWYMNFENLKKFKHHLVEEIVLRNLVVITLSTDDWKREKMANEISLALALTACLENLKLRIGQNLSSDHI